MAHSLFFETNYLDTVRHRIAYVVIRPVLMLNMISLLIKVSDLIRLSVMNSGVTEM